MQRTYQLTAENGDARDAAALVTLIEAGVERRFSDGDFIQYEGDPADGIWILIDGNCLHGHHIASGEFSSMGLSGCGDIFGESAYFLGLPRQYDIVAKGDTTIAYVNRHRLERLLDTDPAVARLLLRSIAMQMFTLGATLKAERSEPARLRLARLLLAQAGPDGLPVVASQQELANLLGISRVALVAALGDLADAGLVSRGYRQLVVVDCAALTDWIVAQTGVSAP